MGGLAGHAGLFGDLMSVKNIGRYFLSAFKAQKNPTEMVIADFARRGIAFDKPQPKGTTRHLSKEAFGHFGYTGTSLWIDPTACQSQGLVIALLTNRVNYSEKPEGIFWLRLAINQAITAAYDGSVTLDSFGHT